MSGENKPPEFVISSDEEREEEEERMRTESSDPSDGEQSSTSSSGSSGKEKTSSETEEESEVEIISGGVNFGKNKASVSVETRSEETQKGEWKGEEKAEDDGDSDARDGLNKKKRRRSNFLLAEALPVSWRTRSYTRNGKRTDYSSFYRSTDSDSGSDYCSEIEEEESGSEDSKSYENSGSDSTMKCSACSLNTDTARPLKRKGKLGKGKEFEASVSSSDCSLDVDEVPILERMNRIREHDPNEEGCSRAPFEEFDAISVSFSDDSEERVRKLHESKRVAKGRRVQKSESRKRCKELADKNLFDFFMASLDADGEDVLESSHNHLSRQLPLVFDFKSDDEIPVEKSDFEKLIDEAWKDYDFALGVENLGSDQPPDEATASRDAFFIATGNYCSNGDHEMHLDEQIGYRCRRCSYIETEIRDTFPPFATQSRKASAGGNQMNENDIFRFNDLHEKHETHDRPDSSFQKTGTVWDLIPGSINTLYPNQKEAFEFMWQNLAGGIRLDEIQSLASLSDKLGGCVISHAPGTGKTRLAIVFLQSYMKAFPNCKPVIIAPAHLLSMWNTEFKKWGFNLPFHDVNCEDFTGKEDKRLLENQPRPYSRDTVRLIKLISWSRGNGVLGISYSLFSNYVSDKSKLSKRIREQLLSKPDLLILDEGHIARNEDSKLWKGLIKVKTKKCIILSGTPFQNNFLELYNILCLFRPTFAKELNVQTETEMRKNHMLSKKKEKPTKDHVWTTPTRNVTAANVEEVRSILKPFVHVYNGEILKSLPGLRECVIILNPEAIQREVIQKLGQALNSSRVDRDCKISLSSIHPYLLTSIELTKTESSLLDMDRLKNLEDDPYAGVKTKFVIKFIGLSNKLKERVLIFSQYVKPLELIKKQLTSKFAWTEGTEILLIHGKIPAKERGRSIISFNDRKSKARVLLASTKACSEGISLTGASRVILLDVVWNPSVGKQAIGRAFRMGQERVVHTYNLITSGTDEMEKYKVQMKKEKLSKLVFSLEDGTSDGGQRDQLGGDVDVPVEDEILGAITADEKLKKIFAKIYYTKSDDSRDYMDE